MIEELKTQKAKKSNQDSCTFCNCIFFEGDKQFIKNGSIFCSEECIKDYEDVFG